MSETWRIPLAQPPQPTVVIAEGLVIRPGDTFIVRLDPAAFTDDDDAADYRERLQADLHQLLPDVRGVVMFAAGQMAVQRAPELDDPARPLVDLAPLPESVPFDRKAGT